MRAIGRAQSVQPFSSSRIFNHTLLIAFLSLLTTVGAILQEAFITARFGISTRTDAVIIAFTTPQIVFGVLSAALIIGVVPYLSAQLTRDEGDFWVGLRTLVWTSLAITAPLALLGAWQAAAVVRFLAPALPTEGAAVARWMSQLIIASLPASVLVEVLRAGLLARRRYTVATIYELLRYAGVVIGLVAWPGSGLVGVTWGYVGGICSQLVLLSVAIRREGGRLHGGWGDLAGLARVWRLMLPAVAGELAVHTSLIVERRLASELGSGTIASLAYARIGVQALIGVVVVALTQAMIPSLTPAVARGTREERALAIGQAQRMAMLLLAPLAVLLAIQARPLVGLLFQRGAFTAEATAQTAALLQLFAPSLLLIGMLQIYTAVFFARERPALGLATKVALLAGHMLLALLLVEPLDAAGLPLAFVLARVVVVAAVALQMQRIAHMRWRSTVYFIVGLALALLLLALATLLANTAIEQLLPLRGHLLWLLQLGLSSVIGIASFIGGLVGLRVVAAETIFGWLRLRRHVTPLH